MNKIMASIKKSNKSLNQLKEYIIYIYINK